MNGISAYVPQFSLIEVFPLLVLVIGAMTCLMVDSFVSRSKSRTFLPLISIASLVAAFGGFYMNLVPVGPFLESSFRADEFGTIGSLVIIIAAIMVTVLAPSFITRRNVPSGEFYALLLFATFGMAALCIANELLTAFICLEIFSISLYVLTALDRRSAKGTEAAFKYLILGAFASAFLVLGIAFLFGTTSTTRLNEMAAVLAAGSVTVGNTALAVEPIFVYAGFALIFVGLCFKLSLAPFHMYAPDVYEGANTPTTMFIATGSKVAAFAFLVHIVETMSYWPLFAQTGIYVIGFVAVASMVWGNLAAIAQSNLKRMLAYSSVAHTGYATVGIVVLAALPGLLEGTALTTAQSAMRSAIIFYLAGYTLMNILAFGIAHYIGGEGQMGAWRGLFHRKPVAAVGMALAMFSLLGLPPTVGFMGKFYVFKEAVDHGFVGLVIVGVLGTAVSAFYYLNLVVTMFMKEEDPHGVRMAGVGNPLIRMVSGENAARVFLLAAAALIIVFGLIPGLFFSLQVAG